MARGRASRVMVYTASLLGAPVPVMPFERGTREFALAVMACGAILSLASLYVVRGEMRLKARGLLGNKLLASASITLVLGLSLVVGSVVYLGRV
jgi:hypothetical protein